MHKNQLQELAQRSCFNLPSYSCIREGPDHAPRFKATVSFNGESFESPGFCSTLRQAEHAAAEVALGTLSKRDEGQTLATRIMDETGICKNLLQEIAQRAGIKLPLYSVERSGPGHKLVFTSTVVLAGMTFTGEPAKNKKQAEKNAAMAAWACLKQFVVDEKLLEEGSSDASEEQLQKIIARALTNGQNESHMQSSLRALTNGQKESHMKSSLPVPSPGVEVSRVAVKQRIQITPFPKSGAEVPKAALKHRSQTTPLPERSELKIDRQPSKNQYNHQTSARSENAAAVSTTWSNKMVSQGHLQYYGMPIVLGSESHVPAMFSTNQVPEVLQAPSTFMIVNDQDFNQMDKVYHSFQATYNPIILMPGNQMMGIVPVSQGNIMMGAFKAASSLAPGVQIRQAVPVCSAPVIPDEKYSDDNKDAPILQAFNEFKH